MDSYHRLTGQPAGQRRVSGGLKSKPQSVPGMKAASERTALMNRPEGREHNSLGYLRSARGSHNGGNLAGRKFVQGSILHGRGAHRGGRIESENRPNKSWSSRIGLGMNLIGWRAVPRCNLQTSGTRFDLHSRNAVPPQEEVQGMLSPVDTSELERVSAERESVPAGLVMSDGDEGFADDDESDNNQLTLFVLLSMVVVLAVLFSAYRATGLPLNPKEALDVLVNMVDNEGPLAYLYFSLVYIGMDLLALPSIPFTTAAGYLFGPVSGTITALLSGAVAASIGFMISRSIGRQFVQRMQQDNMSLKAIDRAIQKEGLKVTALLRLNPLDPFGLTNYILGLTAVSFPEYIAGTIIGFAPGTAAYVYAGHAAKAVTEPGVDGGTSTTVVLLGLVILAAVVKIITDAARRALDEIEAEEEAEFGI